MQEEQATKKRKDYWEVSVS